MTAISKRSSHTKISRARRRHPSVELLETRQLLTSFVVNNANDGGPGSLRRAIANSNKDQTQVNVITFDFGTSGVVQTIDLASPLPNITQPVTIDATTMAGYSGTPLLELNGAGAGTGSNGLQIDATANGTTVKGLDINRFDRDGIDVMGSNNVIAANFIGMDPSGSMSEGNGRQGVLVNGANNTIGGSIAGAGNVISGNGNDGLQIAGSGATGNVAQGNSIGLKATAGGGPASNGRFGILINFQASQNLIGTNGDGVNDALERNIISGNSSWGIEISDPGTHDNVVAGNYIGTGRLGAAAVRNVDGGVLIQDGATSNLIGTDGVSAASADQGNLISGNNGTASPGIQISGSGTNFNVVAGNLIGTDASGGLALGNGGEGVAVVSGARSNVIGTNGDGNGDAAERNVISGNAYDGVYVGGPGTNLNVVAGNLIGVDITGANVVANAESGVRLGGGAQWNRIGVNASDLDAAAEPNVISGNDFSGVSIGDAGTDFNTVSGNWIGNNPADSFTVSNGQDGVSIFRGAQSNTIGGSVALANSIVNNIRNGVGVYGDATTGNTIRFNFIRKNQGGSGIDLGGDGVTHNHGNTPASGPNNLENYPIITSAGAGTTTTVGISFVSLPSSTYTIDFYANPVSDPSGYGEGNLWLGSASVTTDANGQVNPPTTFNLPASTTTGKWITATATDQAGDTSEFSNAWQLTSLASQVTVTPSISSPTYGQSMTFTASVAPFGSGLPTPTGTIQFQVDGSPFGSPVTLVDGAATSLSTNTLPAGGYTVSAAYSGDSNYTINAGTTSQTVSPAPLTITATDKSKVYGSADPALAYTVTGLVNGDDPSIVSGVTLSTATGAVATAGTHAITALGGAAANYAIIDVSGTLTVSKASLTVKADNKGKVFGAADPILTYAPSGTLYYGNTYAVISGVVLSTTTGAAATAGAHAITATGGTAANYAITDVSGTLTVSNAHLTVTADNKSKVYGDADPTLTYTPSGTLFYGDTYSVISGVKLSTATGAAATAGTHPITATGGNAANYLITDASGTLTVRPRPLVTVTRVQVVTVHLTKKKTATDIIITFSGSSNLTGANKLANYHLAAPGKGKKSKTYSKRIILKSAVYSAPSDQVTIQLIGKLVLKPSPQLRITASGILDALGRPLDANGDGQPGGDYVALLTSGGAKPQITRGAGTFV